MPDVIVKDKQDFKGDSDVIDVEIIESTNDRFSNSKR